MTLSEFVLTVRKINFHEILRFLCPFQLQHHDQVAPCYKWRHLLLFLHLVEWQNVVALFFIDDAKNGTLGFKAVGM